MTSKLRSFYKKMLFSSIGGLTIITVFFSYYKITSELENLCQKLTNQFYDIEYHTIDMIAKTQYKINNILSSLKDNGVPVLTQVEQFVINNHNYHDDYILLYDKDDHLVFNSKLRKLHGKLTLIEKDKLSQNKESQIHVGYPEIGRITNRWIVPITSSIVHNNTYQGAIKFSLPLSISKQFESLLNNKATCNMYQSEPNLNAYVISQADHDIFTLLKQFGNFEEKNILFKYTFRESNHIAIIGIKKYKLMQEIFRASSVEISWLILVWIFILSFIVIVGNLVCKPLDRISQNILLLEPQLLKLIPRYDLNHIENIANSDIKHIWLFIKKIDVVLNHIKQQDLIITNKKKHIDVLCNQFSYISDINKKQDIILAEDLFDLKNLQKRDLKNNDIKNAIMDLYHRMNKKIGNQTFLQNNIQYIYSTLEQGAEPIIISDILINYLQDKVQLVKNNCSNFCYIDCFRGPLLKTVDNILLCLHSEDGDVSVQLSHINNESGIQLNFHKNLSNNNFNFEFENEFLYIAKILSLLNRGIVTLSITREELVITFLVNQQPREQTELIYKAS